MFAKLQKAISIIMFVYPLFTWTNTTPTGQIFMKFDIWLFFENVSRNFKFHYNLTRIKGTLHEDICTFMILSH